MEVFAFSLFLKHNYRSHIEQLVVLYSLNIYLVRSLIRNHRSLFFHTKSKENLKSTIHLAHFKQLTFKLQTKRIKLYNINIIA